MPNVEIRGVTVAYVWIKVELCCCVADKTGQIRLTQVADHVSNVKIDGLPPEAPGVRWASVVTGQYDIVAGIRVPDNRHLLDVVEEIRQIDGVCETLTQVLTSYHKDGVEMSTGTNGPP